MALVQLTPVTKGTKDFATVTLFNTDRIVDFYANSGDTVITFYYKEIQDGRTRTIKYTTASTKAAFEAIFDESAYVSRLDIPVLIIYTPIEYIETKVLNLSIADVVKAWDINTTTSYLEFDRGGFEIIKLKVDATIAEIESASSSSVSIAI